MVLKMYKVNFYATETLQNGKERTTLKPVYMTRTDAQTGQRITREQQIERGTKALEDMHYYNIRYGSTIETELFFA